MASGTVAGQSHGWSSETLVAGMRAISQQPDGLLVKTEEDKALVREYGVPWLSEHSSGLQTGFFKFQLLLPNRPDQVRHFPFPPISLVRPGAVNAAWRDERF